MAKIYRQKNDVLDHVLNYFNNYQFIAGEPVKVTPVQNVQTYSASGTGVNSSVPDALGNFPTAPAQAQPAYKLIGMPDPTKHMYSKNEVQVPYLSTPEVPSVIKYTPNFESKMEDEQWYEAIVDNTNLSHGTYLNDYGYLTVHCADAKDGEYVLVNSKGEVQLIEQAQLSEDKVLKIKEFKDEYNTARKEYETYLGLEELAKQGSQWIDIDIEDPHQVNSLTDVLLNTFHEYAKINMASQQLANGQQVSPELMESVDKVAESWAEYGAHTISGRHLMNKEIEDKYGEDWREHYSGSVEAIQEFLDLEEDPMLKQYMAYQLASKYLDQETGEYVYDTATGLGHIAMRTFAELADGGDIFATPIKAAFAPGEHADETYLERLEAGFAPTWSESGHRMYEYDTGNWFFDLALEILSDPTILLNLGAKGLAKAGTSSLDNVIADIVRASSDDVVEEATEQMAKQVAPGLSRRALKTTVTTGIMEGLDSTTIATRIASRIQATPTDEMITTLANAIEYGHAFKISRSLKGASDVIDEVEKFMMMPTVGTSRLFVKGTIAGVGALKQARILSKMETEELVAKAMNDAHIETTKDASKAIDVSNVQDYLNNLDKNVLGINIAHRGKVLQNLTREARIRTVSDVTNNACNDIEEIIYEALHAPKHSPIDMHSRLEIAIDILSGGKCHTVEEYIDEVLRLLKDNDLYDDAIIARLEKTRQIYNNAITTRKISSVAEMYQRLNKIRGQYFETLKVLKTLKPDFSKHIKFKEVINELVEFSGKSELMSFKEFYKTPMVQDRLQKFIKFADEYEPVPVLTFEDFLSRTEIDEAHADELYVRYTTEVAKTNKSIRQRTYDYVTQHNKAVKENNQKVYEDALETYRQYRYALYKDYSDARAEVYDQLIEPYLERLDIEMREVYNSVIYDNNFFPTDAFAQSELARVQTLLEKDVLTSKEWADIYQTVDNMIKVSQQQEYVRLGLGKAELPYTESLVKLSDVTINTTNYSKALKDTGITRTAEDFGGLSQVQGKMYQAKLNKVLEANTLIAEPVVNRMYADIVSNGKIGQELYNILIEKPYKSYLHKATSALIDDAYSAQRYLNITKAIDDAQDIPRKIKNALKDKLFSIDDDTRNLFRHYKSSGRYKGISVDLIRSQARRTAKQWVDKAWKHVSKTNEVWADTFKDLKCCEVDTLSNVRNIEKQFKRVCTEQDAHDYYVFYSMNFVGDSGGLAEFSMRTMDGYEFTIKGVPYSNQIEQQRIYAQIGAEIDKLRAGDGTVRGAGSKGKNLKFVGFNNHATGYDTDRHFILQRYHTGNTTVQLGATIDVAEQIRISKGLPVIPESAYAEAEKILYNEFLQWYTDVHRYDLSLSVVPSVTGKSKFTLFVDGLKNYRNPTDHAIVRRMEELSIGLRGAQNKVTAFNKSLAESGLLYTEHGSNIMPILENIPGNEGAFIIAVKKMYDDKVISRYFDKTLADGNKASVLFEFAQDCDNTLSRIMDYDIVMMHSSEIDEAFKRLAEADNPASTWLADRGIVFKSDLSTTEMFAILHQVYLNLGLKDVKTAAKYIGDEDFTKLIYSPQSIVFRYGREANVFENLHGAVVRDTSMLHSPNTILHSVEEAKQTLTKYLPTIEAQEQALRNAGLTGSLEYAQVQAKQRAAKGLQDYIRETEQHIESINRLYKSVFEGIYENSPLAYRQFMIETTSQSVKFSKAMYEFSKAFDKVRLTYVAMQEPDDIVRHLIKDCNGRLVLDKNYCDLDMVDLILEKTKGLPHIKYDESEDYVRIWFSASELSDDELHTIIEDLSTFSLNPLTGHFYDEHFKGLPEEAAYEWWEMAKDNAKMIEDMAEYGPNNLTYGMFAINTPDFVAKMDAQYFDDVQNDLLDVGTLTALGNYKGQAACMYHGNIANLSSADMFLSNNQFTNICNMYGHIINSLDSTQDVLNVVFDERNQFAAVVETFKAVDHLKTPKEIAESIRANGYTTVVLTADKNGRLTAHSVDVSNSKMYNAALKNRYTTIMRYDTFRELQQQLEIRNLATSSSKSTHTMIERVQDVASLYNAKVRYPFIQAMLFSKPATWLRNIPDSVSKALIKEGTEYLQYIPEAMHTLDAYKHIEDEIYTLYGKVDPISINRYFQAHTNSPMTMDMFSMLKSYWRNPISGSHMENLAKAFNIDPTTIFKRHVSLGLEEKDYKTILDVYKMYNNPDVPMHKRMSQINAELRSRGYDSLKASRLTDVYKDYERLSKYGINETIFDKIPLLNKPINKWLKFNADRFNDVETINRLAIFLKRIEAGDNMGQALKAIGETQFDYTKTDFMNAVEMIAPFSTFKLYNYQFWLDTIWNYHIVEYLGDFARVFAAEDNSEDYWSDENMSYRAMVNAYLDSLDKTDDNFYQEYDSFKDYKGTSASDALEYGWLKVGDKLYLKVNWSYIDALKLTEVIGNPSEFPEFIESNIFAPVQGVMDICKDFSRLDGKSKEETLQSVVRILSQSGLSNGVMLNSIQAISNRDVFNPYEAQDIVLSEFIKEHAYEFTNMFPLVGTIYYSLYSTGRNYNYAVKDGNFTIEDTLTLIPSLFAPGQDKYDKYAESYYARPVGFDWYNQTEEYRKTHRYVVGVSYVPAHVNKDPATYIDTWGRMQQLGIPKEALPELFSNGKSWWFTKDDNGTYKLHNYQLIIKDETAYKEIYSTLLKYGWTAQEAEQLMSEVAVSPWNHGASGDASKLTGYGKYSDMNVSDVLNATLNSSKAALSKAKYNMGRFSGNGKWSQYDTLPKTYRQKKLYARGHDTTRLSKKYQTTYRWYRRTRDIYKDNYAKYGASRMAMEQNLRAYSNRSITEMRRTNQNIRYARIHNRWW